MKQTKQHVARGSVCYNEQKHGRF